MWITLLTFMIILIWICFRISNQERISHLIRRNCNPKRDYLSQEPNFLRLTLPCCMCVQQNNKTLLPESTERIAEENRTDLRSLPIIVFNLDAEYANTRIAKLNKRHLIIGLMFACSTNKHAWRVIRRYVARTQGVIIPMLPLSVIATFPPGCSTMIFPDRPGDSTRLSAFVRSFVRTKKVRT